MIDMTTTIEPIILFITHIPFTSKWVLTLFTKNVIVNHHNSAPIAIEIYPVRCSKRVILSDRNPKRAYSPMNKNIIRGLDSVIINAVNRL